MFLSNELSFENNICFNDAIDPKLKALSKRLNESFDRFTLSEEEENYIFQKAQIFLSTAPDKLSEIKAMTSEGGREKSIKVFIFFGLTLVSVLIAAATASIVMAVIAVLCVCVSLYFSFAAMRKSDNDKKLYFDTITTFKRKAKGFLIDEKNSKIRAALQHFLLRIEEEEEHFTKVQQDEQIAWQRTTAIATMLR